MASPSIFHLSLPVHDLEATRGFYCGLLGAVPGRRTDAWMDLLVFGHQLTFHRQPSQVQPIEDQGVRHFGAILDWARWQRLGATLLASGRPLELPPTIFAAGTPAEHGKVLLRDPSGHLIELKAYRDPATVSAAAGRDQHIGLVSLVVPDYDEALAFYVGVLGFRLLEDSDQPAQGKRWVVVAPPGSSPGTALLLARAVGDAQVARIGDQAGGRVFLFLYTDDFERDYQRYREHGVEFVRPPVQQPYGKVAVFRDPWGNLWDLLQPA